MNQSVYVSEREREDVRVSVSVYVRVCVSHKMADVDHDTSDSRWRGFRGKSRHVRTTGGRRRRVPVNNSRQRRPVVSDVSALTCLLADNKGARRRYGPVI